MINGRELPLGNDPEDTDHDTVEIGVHGVFRDQQRSGNARGSGGRRKENGEEGEEVVRVGKRRRGRPRAEGRPTDEVDGASEAVQREAVSVETADSDREVLTSAP